MAMLRPSLTLVLDLDERIASDDTVLEIRRTYAHICTPVIRTHAASGDDAPVVNEARMLVNVGARKYLHSADEGADDLWNEIVEPWIKNILHKVGNNMKVFNDRQRKIKLPEVVFERVDVELQGGEFVVALHTDPLSEVDESLHEQVGLARELLNAGLLEGAVRVDAPSDESYEAQRESAWQAWIVEHPEALEPKPEPEPEPEPESEPEPELTREEWLARDEEAKSYENTHVAPTDSEALPPIEREEEEEEPEQFDFEVGYDAWSVTFADGSKRNFNAASREFVD